MSYQQTNTSNALSVIYTETEPSTGGFATEAGEAVKQQLLEEKNPLSMLPQTMEECFCHSMWDLSKTCAACGKREMSGAIQCNQSLFNYFNCLSIRACPEHYQAVSAHFEKEEFQGTIVHPNGHDHEIRRCPQCRKNFTTLFDSQNQFCGKECQEDWLNQPF
jgi:hypothetical protein